MSDGEPIGPATTPQWRRGVRFRFDKARQRWMIVAPERILLPEGPGVDIAKLIDGEHKIDDIVKVLSSEYDADVELIRDETMTFVTDLFEQGYLKR